MQRGTLVAGNCAKAGSLIAGAAVLAALVAAPVCLAAPGDLDPSFDGDGKLTTGFGTTPFHPADFGNGVARAPGGEIYVAGESGGDFALVRFTAAGVLDTSFGGGDGIVITDITGPDGNDSANAVAVDAGGSVLVAGGSRAASEEEDFALIRYTSAGVPDPSFGGGDGIVTTDFGGDGEDTAYGVAPLSGGRIAVAGFAETDTDPDVTISDFGVAVYTSTGALDTDFDGDGGSGNGLVTTDFGSDDDGAQAMLVTGSKLVAVGVTDPAGDDAGDFAVARYDATTGVRDTTFDTDGRATYSFGTGSGNGDRGNAVALAAGGKLVVAGQYGPGNGDFAVARISDAGVLDGGFGTGGKTVISFPGCCSTDEVRAVAVQSDDKVLLGGRTDGANGNGAFTVTRLTDTGTADGGFGSGGSVFTDFSPSDFGDGAVGLIVEATAIIAAGTGDSNFAAARYAISNGAPDLTFGGGDGVVDADVPHPIQSSETARAVALQPDGKIVVAGPTDVGAINDVKGDSEFGVARYNANGSLDDGFGAGGVDGNGRVSSNFVTDPDGRGSPDIPEDVAIQSDGKIVVVGGDAPITDPDGDFAVARYTAAGVLDPAFGGGDGLVTTDLGGAEGEIAHAVAIEGTPGDPGFRIVVAGSKHGPTQIDEDYALVVYDDDGNPDATFSGDGIETTDIPGFEQDVPRGVAIQADGRIVAAGSSGGFSNEPNEFSVVRYTSAGAPDPSFGGGDGIVTTDFAGGYDLGDGVAVQELEGGEVRIVVSGRASPDTGTTSDAGLAVYSTDGSLDPSFAPGGPDGDGKLTVDLAAAGNFDTLRSVAIQADGKIVGSGSVEAADFGVMRVTSAGALDSSFGGDGKVATSIGIPPQATAYDLAIQPDGRIVAAGGPQLPFSGSNFAVVRYGKTDVAPPPKPPATTPSAKKCKKKKGKKRSAAAAKKKKCKKKKRK